MSAGRDKLVKMLGMLGSAHDGEVLAAARMIDATVRGSGATWDQLIVDPGRKQEPEPDPGPSRYDFNKPSRSGNVEDYVEVLEDIMRNHAHKLNAWETDFVPSALSQARAFDSLSDKQIACIDRLCHKLRIAPAGFAPV